MGDLILFPRRKPRHIIGAYRPFLIIALAIGCFSPSAAGVMVFSVLLVRLLRGPSDGIND